MPVRDGSDAEYWFRRSLEVKEKAKELGLGPTLITSAEAPNENHINGYLKWVENKMEANMAYMSRPDRIERRLDLQKVLPGEFPIFPSFLSSSSPKMILFII